jgi:hypothetical protein
MANLKRDSSGNYIVRFRLSSGGSVWVRRNLRPVSHSDAERLANALSALYPKGSEEKRLPDAMLLAVPK